jgi:hypothetical protein
VVIVRSRARNDTTPNQPLTGRALHGLRLTSAPVIPLNAEVVKRRHGHECISKGVVCSAMMCLVSLPPISVLCKKKVERATRTLLTRAKEIKTQPNRSTAELSFDLFFISFTCS